MCILIAKIILSLVLNAAPLHLTLDHKYFTKTFKIFINIISVDYIIVQPVERIHPKCHMTDSFYTLFFFSYLL